MEPTGKIDTQKIPENNNYRRAALFGDFDLNLNQRKSNTKRRRINVEPAEKSNSFKVPPINKRLKNLTVEELKSDDNTLAILGILSAAFALVENEETFMETPQEHSNKLYLRFGILITSIASVIWIIRRYQMLLILKTLKYTSCVSDNLYTSGLYKTMIIEIIIHSLFSPPGYDYFFSIDSLGYKITYSLDDIFTFLALLRLYTLLRLFGHHSIYTQSTAETVCERNCESADTTFAIKSFIQDSPFLGIGIVFLSLSLFSAVSMRIAERPPLVYENLVYKNVTVTDSHGEYIKEVQVHEPTVKASMLETLADNLWVIFFTTTTVGYGNIYPVTHMGRLACILACIFGNMYLGMLVVAIHQKMDHSDNENLAYAWIYRHYAKIEARKYAAEAIKKAATLYLLSTKRWKKGTISYIKPNSAVCIEGELELKFDMNFLTKEQYIKKCQIYREMKNNLSQMAYCIKDARNTGQSDVESIRLIEDTVRVDTSLIFKKIQNVINSDTLMVNSSTISLQHSLEKQLLEMKDSANSLRSIIRKSIRKKTSQDDSPLYRKHSINPLVF